MLDVPRVCRENHTSVCVAYVRANKRANTHTLIDTMATTSLLTIAGSGLLSEKVKGPQDFGGASPEGPASPARILRLSRGGARPWPCSARRLAFCSDALRVCRVPEGPLLQKPVESGAKREGALARRLCRVSLRPSAPGLGDSEAEGVARVS